MQRPLIRSIAAAALFAASIVLGYAFTSSLGQDFIRREAEIQLTNLMRGATTIRSARLRVSHGLWLDGEDVSVYPASPRPGLTGRRVSARIDVVALMTGRFRLRALVLEGVHMQIERSAADVWWPHPIAALDKRGEDHDPDDLERKLGILSAFEKVVRGLMKDPTVAQRIELRGGSVELIDRFVAGGEAAEPLVMGIDGVAGELEFGWLNRSADLRLNGFWNDTNQQSTPIEIHGTRRRGAGFLVDIAFTSYRLESLHAYLQPQDAAARSDRSAGRLTPGNSRPFAGELSGVIHYLTPEPEHGILELDWIARELDSGLLWGGERLSLDSPQAALELQIEVHPGRVRLERAEFRGANLDIDFAGSIDRPLRDSSPATFSVDLYGIGLDEARQVARALPEAERRPMLRVLDHIRGGNITRLGGQGTARFSTWREILRGKQLDLPESLGMRADFEGIDFDSLDGQDQFSDMSGHVEWTGDRIQLRCPHMMWNDRPMPGLDISVVGFPLLFEEEHEKHILQSRAAPIPGFSLFREIFFVREDVPAPETDDAEQTAPAEFELIATEPAPASNDAQRKFPKIEIEFDRFEHPTLHWPIHDAGVRVEAIEGGVALRIHRGHWGDTNMTGDIHWTRDPEPPHAPHITAMIDVKPRSRPSGDASAANDRENSAQRLPSLNEMARSLELALPGLPASEAEGPIHTRWAVGRFFIDDLATERLPVSSVVGAFVLDGHDLHINDLEGHLTPSGSITSELSFGLGDSRALDVDVQFEIKDGDADPISRSIGFDDGFARGELDATGELSGPLRPNQLLLAELDGAIRFEARHGDVSQSIPLVAALSHALEGLDPVAAGKALRFEKLEADLAIEQGRISTQNLRLDGPLRIFIAGDFDVARPGRAIEAEIGIFIFRQVDKILGKLPLINVLMPGGREKGLIGAYFEAQGRLEEPELRPLKMRTLTEGILLPDLIKTPFKAIRKAIQTETRLRQERKAQQPAGTAEAGAPAKPPKTFPASREDKNGTGQEE